MRRRALVLVAVVMASLAALLIPVASLADSYDTQAVTMGGAVTYYAMSETSTSFADPVAGNTCAWHSSLSHSSDGPGSASGSGDFVNYSYCEMSASLAFGGDWSLAWWWKSTGSSVPDNMPVYDGCTNSGSCTNEIRVWVDVAGKPCAVISGGYSACGSVSSLWSDSGSSGWHMSAVTQSGTSMKWYLDGVLDTTTTLGGVVPSYSSANGLIGARWANGDYLASKLSRWLLSNTAAWSGTSIATLYTYSAGSPATGLNVLPFKQHAVTGGSVSWVVNGSAGPDTISGSPVTSPVGGLSSCSGGAGTETCTAGPVGQYLVTWFDTVGNTETTELFVAGTGTRFELASNGELVHVGTTFQVWGVAFDASGNNISQGDSWTLSVPSGASCSSTFYVSATTGVTYDCHLTAAGTVTFSGTDQYGFYATLQVTETVAPAAGGTVPACGTQTWPVIGQVPDFACWANVAIEQLLALPGNLARALIDFLFVSQTGPSYIDFSHLSFVPTIACRSGEVPTAADGVHCVPFPFSLPRELLTIWGVIDVTATPPVFDWYVHFGVFNVHVPITPAVILTTPIMDMVHGVIYVLFVMGLVVATRKYVEMFGVD